MKACIQCNSAVDFLSDTFTLYQVDGNRYLYCEECKNPREPYISQVELGHIKEDANVTHKALAHAKMHASHYYLLVWLLVIVLGVINVLYSIQSFNKAKQHQS